MRSTLPRAAVALVAVVAVAWLAGNLRSLHQADAATTKLAGASATGAPPAELERAASGFRAAQRFGDDTALLITQARALVYGRGGAEASPLARRAVRNEPDNVDAWVLLYASTRRSDPAGAARARVRALDLDPRLARQLPPVSP